MSKQPHLHLLALLALAGILTWLKIPLASSQGLTIVAAPVNGPLPLEDPDDDAWTEATAVSVPLSAQIVARPMFSQANVRAVDARALFNDAQIAFLVEWQDESRDEATVRVQDFSDAVAIQFPLVEGQPFFCMGQQGGNVNIWHWKADWQAAMTGRQDVDTAYPDMYVDGYPFADERAGAAATVADYEDVNYVPALAAGNLMASVAYTSPVEDLIAGSFGSLTSQPIAGQNVQGHGEYADGKWRVIFVRDLVSPQAEDARFASGEVVSLAFAAWDGANEERNGQKSTSQWVSLQLGGPVAGEAGPGAGGQAAAPGPLESAGPRTQADSFEGMPFVFVPMLAVLGLLLVVSLGILLLSRLPDKK